MIETKGWSLRDAGQWLADKWQQLENRYGRKAALTMALGMIATAPLPGNIAAIVGIAEGIRGLHGIFTKEMELEVLAKCDHGRNQGKPGPCPDDSGGSNTSSDNRGSSNNGSSNQQSASITPDFDHPKKVEVPKGVRGEGTKSNPYRCGPDIKTAAKLLAAGHHIELSQPDELATLTDKLAKMIHKAQAAGQQAPSIDLCKVSMPNSNLFCSESLGFPRINMPQMRGMPVAGSYASTLKPNKAGKVDVSKEFIEHLNKEGIGVKTTEQRASHLRASQAEIVGARIIELMDAVKNEGKDLRKRPIFVTKDNYVLDGHHHWAALVALGAGKGKDYKVPVHVVDIDIGTAITMANDFAKEAGIAPKSGKSMKTKSIKKGTLYKTDDAERSATFVLSTGAEDRDGETVNPEGGDFEDYAKNPVVAFNHNTDDFPIGTSGSPDGKVAIWTETIEVDGEQKPALLGKCFFSEANPKGQLAFEMVKEGTLRGCSISFLPLGQVGKNQSGGNYYERWKLLEWSICPIGSNADAVKLSKKFSSYDKSAPKFHQGDRVVAEGEDAIVERVVHNPDGTFSYMVILADDPGSGIEVKETDVKRKSHGRWPREKGYVLQAYDGRYWSDSKSGWVPDTTYATFYPSQAAAEDRALAMDLTSYWLRRFGKMARKMWVKNKTAWLKSQEGPLDEETQAHIQELGLDEVRIEDTEPVEEGWEETGREEKRGWEHDATIRDLVQQIERGVLSPYDAARRLRLRTGMSIEDAQDTLIEARTGAGKRMKAAVEELETRIEQEVPKVVDANNEVVERCGDMMKSDGVDDELVERAKRLVRKKLKRKSLDDETGPMGLRALRRWMKAIEEDMEEIEEKNVLGAGDKAIKLMKQAMRRAYKDIVSDAVEESDSNDADDDPPQKSVSKKLSKAKRAELKEMADYLEDAASAMDTPKRLSAGMKLYAQKCKDLMGPDEVEVKNDDDLTDEQLAELDKAFQKLADSEASLTQKMFRATGVRF